jgi:hypothetical protein
MNVEIEAEAALFPEKEYIKGIFVAVYSNSLGSNPDISQNGRHKQRSGNTLWPAKKYTNKNLNFQNGCEVGKVNKTDNRNRISRHGRCTGAIKK